MANPNMIFNTPKNTKKRKIQWIKTEHAQGEVMLLNLALFHENQWELKTGGRFWVVLTHEQWHNHHAAHIDETETKKQKWMIDSTHSSVKISKINKINMQISPKSMVWLWKRRKIRSELAEPGQFLLSKCFLVATSYHPLLLFFVSSVKVLFHAISPHKSFFFSTTVLCNPVL